LIPQVLAADMSIRPHLAELPCDRDLISNAPNVAWQFCQVQAEEYIGRHAGFHEIPR
jgi:hypothetical protein